MLHPNGTHYTQNIHIECRIHTQKLCTHDSRRHKHPNGPKIGHAFSRSRLFFFCKKCSVFHVYRIMFVHFGSRVPVRSHENVCLRVRKTEQIFLTFEKRMRFFGSFVFRHSASDSFPSYQLADGFSCDVIYIRVPVLRRRYERGPANMMCVQKPQ